MSVDKPSSTKSRSYHCQHGHAAPWHNLLSLHQQNLAPEEQDLESLTFQSPHMFCFSLICLSGYFDTMVIGIIEINRNRQKRTKK